MLFFSKENGAQSLLKIKHFAFFAVYVFILMFFCAGSSPFIDFMATDSSVFFAIGRSMAAGKTVYLDVFDHKGWYLYLINYLGALISSSTSIGIFLVEYVFYVINAILLYHIAAVWFHQTFKRIVFAMLMMLLLLNYFTHSGGNITETYATTLQLLSIWLLLRYSRTEQLNHPPVFMLVHGVCVGIVFGLRANMIMMWGAVAIVIVVRLFYYKLFKNALMNIGFGFCGLLLAAIPPVLYGAITGSLVEMINHSIVFNLQYSDIPLVHGVLRTFSSFVGIGFLICGVVSIIIVCLSSCKRHEKVLFALMVIFSYVSVGISGRKYYHYFAYLLPFTMPILVKILSLFNDDNFSITGLRKALVVCIIVVATICCNLRTPIRLFFKPNSFYNAQTVTEMSDLYEQLPEKEGRKVLVTKSNANVYNKMNVIPDVLYFYLPSISYEKYPYAVDCQANSILSGENDVVVLYFDDFNQKKIFNVKDNNEEMLAYLEQNYELVYEKPSQAVQMWVKSHKDIE